MILTADIPTLQYFKASPSSEILNPVTYEGVLLSRKSWHAHLDKSAEVLLGTVMVLKDMTSLLPQLHLQLLTTSPLLLDETCKQQEKTNKHHRKQQEKTNKQNLQAAITGSQQGRTLGPLLLELMN